MTHMNLKRAAVFLIALAFISLGSTWIVYGSSKAADIKTITYTTHEHDTLWSIAAHFDPNANTQEVISEIEQLNHLNDNDFLQVDKQLIIPIQK